MADFTYDDYEKIVITQKGPIYICAFNDAGNLNAMSYQLSLIHISEPTRH